MILKEVNELSSKMDKLTAYIKSSYMDVKDSYSNSLDTSSCAFPLKPSEEMGTVKAALEEQKFRDQFVSCDSCL